MDFSSKLLTILINAEVVHRNMKFKKLIFYVQESDPLKEEFEGKLREFAENVVTITAEKEYSRSLTDLGDADAFVTKLFDYYDDSLFEKSNLEYIGAMHTDISHFNQKFLENEGIELKNVEGYATEAVAELTISALLTISRQTHDAMNFVKEGNWGFEKFMGWELKGKTLGIIGLGRIGSRVKDIAQCLGMNVYYYTQTKRDNDFLELDELLKRSDIVSLHCALTNQTKNILNESNLKMMKQGSVLLNSARSELVDLDALYKSCKEGKIFAWFEAIEEKEIRDKFRKLKNVYLTPHMGWMTKEAQNNLMELTLNNIRDYLEKKQEEAN